MIWLTWRQFRGGAAMMAAALAVLAALLALTGPGLADDYSSGIAACTTQGGGCSDFVQEFFTDHQIQFLAVIAVVLVLPALIGLFWGAPLIARELEAGTHRLVWNQSITRTRWLAVKLGLTGLAAMIAAGLGSLAGTWWSSPIDNTATTFPRMEPLLFAARGIVPIGYAAFAFTLGVTVGMLVRRTLPAMAITLAVFVAAQIAMPLLVRPHLFPPPRGLVQREPRKCLGPVQPRRGPLRTHRRPHLRVCVLRTLRTTHQPTGGSHRQTGPGERPVHRGLPRRDHTTRLPPTSDLPALQPLLALPVVRDRDLHHPRPRPRRVLLLADPPTPLLTQTSAAQRTRNGSTPTEATTVTAPGSPASNVRSERSPSNADPWVPGAQGSGTEPSPLWIGRYHCVGLTLYRGMGSSTPRMTLTPTSSTSMPPLAAAVATGSVRRIWPAMAAVATRDATFTALPM
jgi:hypothetical protein